MDSSSSTVPTRVRRTFYGWRAGVDGKRPEERIEIAGLNATAPTITPAGDLVFSRFVDDVDVYRLGPGLAVRPVAPSSAFDGNPQFSPNGRRLTFCSSRSGDALEIWTAASDGFGSASADTRSGHLEVLARVVTRRPTELR